MSKLKWLPNPIRSGLHLIRNFLRSDLLRTYKQKQALNALAHTNPKKIVIGSSGTSVDGWVSTDKEVLNLLRENTWAIYFTPNSLDCILAEHVWEHLHPHEAVKAAMTCHTFLKQGGYLRVAVPDGMHPDQSYIDSVMPGGTGAGAEDHKVLYTYASFRDLFISCGFNVCLHEYFDEHGQFHSDDWNPIDGMVRRSKRFDPRNSLEHLAYTSIILDAIKLNANEITAGGHQNVSTTI